MQHSADFTSLHSHHADVARAEWELEVRRLADERGELTTEPAIAIPEPSSPLAQSRAAYDAPGHPVSPASPGERRLRSARLRPVEVDDVADVDGLAEVVDLRVHAQ
jgi:hypothetical protein